MLTFIITVIVAMVSTIVLVTTDLVPPEHPDMKLKEERESDKCFLRQRECSMASFQDARTPARAAFCVWRLQGTSSGP